MTNGRRGVSPPPLSSGPPPTTPDLMNDFPGGHQILETEGHFWAIATQTLASQTPLPLPPPSTTRLPRADALHCIGPAPRGHPPVGTQMHEGSVRSSSPPSSSSTITGHHLPRLPGTLCPSNTTKLWGVDGGHSADPNARASVCFSGDPLPKSADLPDPRAARTTKTPALANSVGLSAAPPPPPPLAQPPKRKKKGSREGKIGQGGRGRTQDSERPMGTIADGGKGHHRRWRERVQGKGSEWRSANWRRPLQTRTTHLGNMPTNPPPPHSLSMAALIRSHPPPRLFFGPWSAKKQ